jgi:hypothetical protein
VGEDMKPNRLIMISVCAKTGLLNYPHCEQTDKSVCKVVSAINRGKNTIARIVAAKEIDGRFSNNVWDYLTDSEIRQCKIAHVVRVADRTTKVGRLTSHVAANVRSFLKSRELNVQGIMLMHIVSDGWWLKSSSTWLWSELGGLMRALEKATLTPENSIESPYYDPIGVE